jgi:hypothetical protein
MKTRGLVVLTVVVMALAPGRSLESQSARFAFERPVTTAGTGPRRLPVDQPLLIGGSPFEVVRQSGRSVAAGGLADLRFVDGDGRPVPYLLVHSAGDEPQWLNASILPVQQTRTTSGFEADFGSSQTVDALDVAGIPAPFLKRLTVEGSGDRRRWTLLASEATLFDLPQEQLRQTQVGFSPGGYRYIRVTWDDTNSGRVPLPRQVRARRTLHAIPVRTPPLELAFDRQPSEPGRSRYRVRLPAARLPIVGLELDVAGGHVFRAAAVTESRFSGSEAAPLELGRATLSRVVRGGVQASNLRVEIAPPTESELQLLIEDGSNPPLEVKRVLAAMAELPVIYLEAKSTGIVARYGDRGLQKPVYDLEAIRGSIDIARVPDAQWGSPRALVKGAPAVPDTGVPPQPGGTVDLSGFRHLRPVPAAPAGLVSLQLDAAVLAHSRGPADRFADVRILDESNRQIPYLLERRDEPLDVELALTRGGAEAAELQPAAGRQLSVYDVTLPYGRLPSCTLVIETTARVFQRNVRLGVERPPDRSRRQPWFEVLASATWQHAERDSPARALSLKFTPPADRGLLLVIDEGDNAALPIAAASLLLPSFRLRYYHPEDGSLRLAYGREDFQPPRYDLALLAQHVMGAPARELTPAAEPQDGAAAGGDSFISPLTFWVLLGAAAAVLVGLIAKLVRA